ncbi:hypothetical protein BN13_1900009 [Nostocoides jenkinsii Ben 74]|uniref:Uncharacterized protein n=1 Tax=Nostocoides jenkinsii Ben 74 TaxID=1193518 RepID=A0A077M7T4_9MICO|nr:hypothetical protein BN13_1900009 [Tetrasphaera jenkinsii Ben 74]
MTVAAGAWRPSLSRTRPLASTWRPFLAMALANIRSAAATSAALAELGSAAWLPLARRADEPLTQAWLAPESVAPMALALAGRAPIPSASKAAPGTATARRRRDMSVVFLSVPLDGSPGGPYGVPNLTERLPIWDQIRGITWIPAGQLLLAVLRSAQSVVDLLADRAHGELVGIAARHPHLAAQRNDRLARQRRLQDLLLAHIVGEALVITGLLDLRERLRAFENGGRGRGAARLAGRWLVEAHDRPS